MHISLTQLHQQLVNGFVHRGLEPADAAVVAEALVEAELRGKRTHGIGKAFLMDGTIKARQGKPEVIKSKGNYALINAHKELGHLSANLAVDILLAKVKEFDNALVAVTNSYYYSMAGIYAAKVARAGYVAIILNNGGPAAITPFGGVDPILGTNPIAIGIPTDQGPLVLDMTTGEQPWGAINLAKVEGRPLRPETFFDKAGQYTTDPTSAEAIKPFGGHKGYGLNLMFEILTGALVGAKMGLQAKNGYDLGFLFMAYSPEMFTTSEAFKAEVAQLIQEIKASRKMPGVTEIWLPGEQSDREMAKNLAAGEVEISDEMYHNLGEFEKGVNLEERLGLKG